MSSPRLCERPAGKRVLAPTEDLLIRCVSHTFGGDEVRHASNDVDWGRFITLAREQGVLHWLGSNQSLTTLLPAHVLDAARSERTVTAERNLLLSAELVRLLGYFREAGVEVLVFKGVIAAIQFYGDLVERPSGDLDLLVRVRDYPRAAATLIEAGYEPGVEYLTSLQRAFSHSGRGTDVDLHWGVPPTLPRFSARVLWRHRAQVELIGTRVPTFDKHSATAVTAVNAVKAYWNVSLRQHIDVTVALRSLNGNEWRTLLRRAKRIGCLHCVLAAARVSDSLFPNILPAHISSDALRLSVATLISDEVIQHLFDRSRSAPPTRVFATRSDYDSALDSRTFGRYADGLRRAIAPNAADEEWLELPPHLRFLYYVLRPLRLLLIGRRREPTE